ncbi:ubiquitin-like modifier protein SAMP2 [Natronomonas pharaonis DSM 2160]|uniref:Ubiquitin-like modifier protein SAMP2 n=1 Tax=Natronomonas pharaonis (strain ATCC 35678 / DSM 2160 / CIP 103997 / JCM 8858 / NBRC 14720 / NCIMB 2260 / Gabara) TaxID=348780 RepID=A0A1U7EUA2_NATPD|nr:ubiquitin-like small modifier protein 2 [Natronomonas pharaonis]CAI48542.1 ubiquitin-like modifier protein SAMP2 [Natronomonas pharaonis DSM 2160]
MRVTCDIVGEDTRELDVDEAATYGDLLEAVGLSSHEASVLVDGSPVPEDRTVDSDSVRILRLIKGG